MFTGLAAGQDPSSEFAADRPPAVLAPALMPPTTLSLPVVQVQDKDKAPPTTDKPAIREAAPAKDAVKTIPPAAGSTALPPPVSVLPPGGVTLAPGGGTVILGDGQWGPQGPQAWASAEYLWWRLKKDEVPPLVTTSPAAFPVGFLGNPGTTVLFAGPIDQGTLNGLRLRGGLWLDPCHTCGLDVSGFWLDQQDRTFPFNSGQFPVLARPFTDVNPGGPNSEFLAFPGIATGTVAVRNEVKFCGATAAARCPICSDCRGRIDGLVGFQYLNLEEELTVVETPLALPTSPFAGTAGTQFVVTDTFRTRNQFYGGFVGLDAWTTHGCWAVGLTGSLGVGCNRQTIEIAGSQVAIPPSGPVVVTPGGLLALPGANAGRFDRNEFSIVPQIGINLGYQVSPNVVIFGGYTCLYWTNVVRPGAQIDPTLDVNRIPNFGGGPPATANRPIVPFIDQTFWAQGVSAGIRFSW
jgi:hypothetical protein